MRLRNFLLATAVCVTSAELLAEAVTVAEDDASQTVYGGSWDSNKNGGSGFGNWTLTAEGNDADHHAGFFIASTDQNQDLNSIAKEKKAFGLYANGTGFEQAVAYRSITKPLAVGDSFSFMMETGLFEKKFDKDDPALGSVGLVLRSGNATASVSDYNKDPVFEFGHYNGKPNYQIYDGSGADKTDSGVAFSDAGVAVTVTITGSDTYDLEIQTLKDKNVTKLPGRKLASGSAIQSFAVFDRNSEKSDAFFNQFQISQESK